MSTLWCFKLIRPQIIEWVWVREKHPYELRHGMQAHTLDGKNWGKGMKKLTM
jgi:hypothetical protein